MDIDAAARGRRKQVRIQWDLLKARNDEEACPPVWVDLLMEITRERDQLVDEVARETERYISEPDIRVALARRERIDAKARRDADAINAKIKRLNLLVPNPRFQRRAIDADELLRPLWRTPRAAAT